MLPLVALSVFVAWLLYFRKQEESAIPRPLRIFLGVTRWMVIMITGLLIISPWIRTTVKRQRQPWFIIARDNSVSITQGSGTDDLVRSSGSLDGKLKSGLSSRYQVKEVLFGSSVREGDAATFTDDITDPGALFDYLRQFSRTHDLGGILLASDGVATRGVSFSEAASGLSFPVYVMASGDSVATADVRIREVVTNERVRRNSTFPVRVYFNADGYSGAGVKVKINGSKGVLAEQVIPNPGQAPPYADFSLQSPDKGIMQLTAVVEPEIPDKNLDNNHMRFSVKVVGEEGEVLFVYEAPHPDIDAAMQALRETSALNITKMSASEYLPTDKKYDLVILHGLPSFSHPLGPLMKMISDRQVPVLYLLTATTDPTALNRERKGITLGEKRRKGEAARGILNQSFNLFNLPADFASHLATWPPLMLGFESAIADPGAQVMLFQKILNLELSDPLAYFISTGGSRYGYVCGEGIWLWRLHEYLEQKNHAYFDEWFSKSVQYLMADEREERFRVNVPEELFGWSSVRINAHLLNKSLEEINDPEVSFKVTDSAGRQTDYQMGRINDYYELIINGFAPGNYRYAASVDFGSEKFLREGDLIMLPRQVEQVDPAADYPSLRLAASASGGYFFKTGEEDKLIDFLEKLKPAAQNLKPEYKWFDLINFKWLLLILFVLLAMEWFLRRWFGIR